jgi:hypothetical protein
MANSDTGLQAGLIGKRLTLERVAVARDKIALAVLNVGERTEAVDLKSKM